MCLYFYLVPLLPSSALSQVFVCFLFAPCLLHVCVRMPLRASPGFLVTLFCIKGFHFFFMSANTQVAYFGVLIQLVLLQWVSFYYSNIFELSQGLLTCHSYPQKLSLKSNNFSRSFSGMPIKSLILALHRVPKTN